ncbi:cell pole-organizing protein PopZ [Sphingobium xenophagum]|uniref:Cell pole-organizing protein PopZ n=2 Tax=Sphingobium xenophagum TaxID=121428 RepID=A0ABU1X3G2_SPHXE|nr:cell pole-organizing protein PopZ [Sphingobium xenophagum]
MSKEPSMEEILSSIKRIIAEEGEEAAQSAPRRVRADAAKAAAAPAPADLGNDEILELTQEVSMEDAMPAPKAASPKSATAKPAAAAPAAETILSVESEVAARHSLSALSSMLIAPQDGGDNTLEGLVRSLLKPMLKEWLDARLPILVEEMVAKEIARITAR